MSMTSMSVHSNSEHKSALNNLAAELERAEGCIKSLQADKRRLEQEVTKQKLLSSRSEQKLSLLENDLIAKDDKLAMYKEQLHMCETNLYETQLRTKDEISKLRDKSDLSKTLEGVIIKLNTKCEDLEGKYSKLSEESSFMTTNNKVLQEENDKLHARVTEQSDAMYSRDLAREESRRKIGELSKEVQQIRFELEDAQAENATLKAKQRDYEEALIKSDGSLNYTRECAEEEAEKANRKITELNNLVRDLESERRELEISLTAAEDSHDLADKELMKRERMRRNLQGKLSHLVSMLHATLPGIQVTVPRVKLTLNDEGESTDVEYTESTTRSASPHAQLPADEQGVDVESVRQAILALKKQATIHENECRDLKGDLRKAQDELEDAESKGNKLSRDCKSLTERLQTLEKEKSGYRDQLDSARGSMHTLEESRRELQVQLDELEQQKNETAHQNQMLEREITGLKGKLSEEEDELNEMRKMRDSAHGEIDSLVTKYDMLKKHKDQVESERNSLERQLKGVVDEKAVLESRLESIHQTLEQSEKEKIDLQANVAKLQKTCHSTQDKIGSLESTLTSLEKKLKSHKEENSELRTKLSTVNTEASNLRRDKDLLDEKINNMTADMQAVSHKLIDQQDKITKLQTAATDNEMSRIKAEGQIRSANLALQQKSSELRTQSNKVELLTTENKHLQSSVSGLTGKVNSLEREKRELNESVLSLQTEKKLNQQSRASHEKQITSLQEALKEREDSVRNYESKMNSSEIQAEKNKRELKKLEYLLGETEVGSKDRIHRLEEKYKSELDRERKLVQDKDKIVTLEQERSEGLRKKINELQDQIAQLNVTIHRQEATKKSYQDRIENKTAENKDLRSLLNETYNLQDEPATRLSYNETPERLNTRSPDMKNRSPERSVMSPERGSSYRTSPIRRRRSISPIRRAHYESSTPVRRRTSPLRYRSPTRNRSPSPSRTWRYKDSPYKPNVMSEEVKKDLSNITERTEDRSSSSHHSDHGKQANQDRERVTRDQNSTNQEAQSGLEVDNKELKCLRCRSPIGLTLA